MLILLLPGEPLPPPFTLALVGDVMLGRGVALALAQDWEAAFAEVAPILQEADLAFGNLESPLTTARLQSAGHDLRAEPEAASALGMAGFDVLSLANNHSLDAGEAGLAQTRQALTQAGVLTVGEGERVCVPQACVLALHTSLAVPPAAVAAVAAAKQSGRLLIVSLHWGAEYQAAPAPAQRALARALAAAGADLIVGHGPHVLQPMEWVGHTLLAYSLGNFLFDQPYPLDCRRGAILRLTVRWGRLPTLEVIPTVAEQGGVRLASGEDAAMTRYRLGQDAHLTFSPDRVE